MAVTPQTATATIPQPVASAAVSEAAAYRLIRECDRLLAIEPCGAGRTLELLHQTVVALHGFAAAILACEDAGLTRRDLLPALDPVRRLHAQSPFVHRLQAWPRGYAGDFETVEWICDARNRAESGTVPWALEQCALQSPLAQQHRNKVALQARAILKALVTAPTARIASIGCGGCRDLSVVQDCIPAGHGRFVLVDADADALDFARARLDRLAGRCTFVHGRIPRILSKLRPEASFDLIVAGGLFDYLPDRWALATLVGIRRLLAPGGRLFLSNIASGNPFRPWIEYLAEWWLIERQENDMRRLLEEAGFDPGSIVITRDCSGLALLVEAVT